MEDKNTHDIILQEALRLFSESGYAAVSMRDIAAAVGIRVSSIYHHFSSKQELFNALVQKVSDIKNSLQTVFLNAFSKAGAVEEEAFVQTGVFFLTGYLKNEQVEPLLKVLECERFHNEDADKAWQELLIITPLEHEKHIFQMLKERGEIVNDDAEELAAEYQAAIMFSYFTGDTKQLQMQLQRIYRRTFIHNK